MPALEALQDQFEAANTQPLGVSVDSVFSHANWAAGMGGVSFPLLADFHPKGEMAKAYGVYLEDKGITDRATIIIDAGGTVRHASSVTPAGQRDMAELAKLCAEVDRNYSGTLQPTPKPTGVAGDATLYVRNQCGFSRAVLLARDNLHLGDRIVVRNVSDQPELMQELRTKTGKEQAPCLVVGDTTLFESAEIIRYLTQRCTAIAG